MIDPREGSDAPGHKDGFGLLGPLTVFSTDVNDRLSARGQRTFLGGILHDARQ